MKTGNFFKKNRGPQQKGFIKIILLVITALVLIKYVYDIDIVGFLTQGKFREFLDKFYELGGKGWEKYSELLKKVWFYILEFIKNLFAKTG